MTWIVMLVAMDSIIFLGPQIAKIKLIASKHQLFQGTAYNTDDCTFQSRNCGLNPGSWKDFDELDCADCCYGYHDYLDEFNQNKAYCMQDPKATSWRV